MNLSPRQRGANLFGAVAELVGEVLRRVLAVDKSVFEHEQHRFGRDFARKFELVGHDFPFVVAANQLKFGG